jgi:nucleoside-diphosphate-sugar epimerase
MNHMFIFGLGYSATAIATTLKEAGWRVTGTVLTPAKLDAAAIRGIVPRLFANAQAVQRSLESATHCLISAPPGEAGDPVLAAYAQALRAAPRLRWLGYLSTVGVYGDLQGGWADEETPANPDGGRNARRLDAERAWTGFCQEPAFCEGRALPLDIFRLAGIYGPGRSPLERIRAGEAQRIVKPGQVFNRIHVDDIAQIVAAAAMQAHGRPAARIFNAADDEPAPPQDVIAYAAELLGIAPPPEIPFDSATLSAMARSFYESNKRIRNDRIKRELGVVLKYPTYREGLRALLAGPEEAPESEA